MTMNVQIRIITEDNVDQLTSMSYSNNISLLLKDEKITPKDIKVANEKARTAHSKAEGDVAIQTLDVEYNTTKPKDEPLEQYDYGKMYTSDVTFKVGDDVEFTRDGKYPSRRWTIDSINNQDNDYVLTTEDMVDLPGNAILNDTGTRATVVVNKLYLSQYPDYIPSTTNSAGYIPDYDVNTPDYSHKSPEYSPKSPEYSPKSPEYIAQSPEYIAQSPDEESKEQGDIKKITL